MCVRQVSVIWNSLVCGKSACFWANLSHIVGQFPQRGLNMGLAGGWRPEIGATFLLNISITTVYFIRIYTEIIDVVTP